MILEWIGFLFLCGVIANRNEGLGWLIGSIVSAGVMIMLLFNIIFKRKWLKKIRWELSKHRVIFIVRTVTTIIILSMYIYPGFIKTDKSYIEACKDLQDAMPIEINENIGILSRFNLAMPRPFKETFIIANEVVDYAVDIMHLIENGESVKELTKDNGEIPLSFKSDVVRLEVMIKMFAFSVYCIIFTELLLSLFEFINKLKNIKNTKDSNNETCKSR